MQRMAVLQNEHPQREGGKGPVPALSVCPRGVQGSLNGGGGGLHTSQGAALCVGVNIKTPFTQEDLQVVG